MPVIPDNKDKLVNLEDMRALYEHELRDSTVKFIDGQPGFTPAGSMQLGTGCVGSLTPVERFGICKVTSGSMSDLTDFSSAFSMTNVGFSCSPDEFNGSSTASYDGSSTMKNSLAGFESNKNKSVLYADIDEMEVDGGSSSYTGNRARAAITSSFLDGISSALILGVSDRHREFDLTLQVTSGEYSMSSDSPVFVKTDPNLSPIGKLAPVSPSPSVPMILPEIDDLPTPRRTDADLPGLVVPDDDTIVCKSNGIISIKDRGVSEPLLSPDVTSQLTGLQEIGPTGIANIENALPGPLVETKVMGQSNQITTTGKNLFNWDSYINDYQFDTSDSGKGFYYAKFQVGAGKTVAVSVDKVVASGEYLAFANGKFGENKKAIWLAHSTVAVKNGTLTPDAEGNVWIWFGNSKQNIQRLYDTGVKVQVEIGTKATAWEPYTGGKPSPSLDYPQEIINLSKAELVVAGKNLADVNESDNVNFTLYKEPLPAGTYTFSCDKGKSSGFLFNVKELDDSGIAIHEIVTSRTSPCTFTISEPMALFINGWGLSAPYNIGSIQLEAGSKATAYEPTIKPKATPIDLQGNELCSLPNGVKDEVVIDTEGNVSLIKRTKQYNWNCIQIIKGTGRNYAVDKVLDIGANYTGLVAEKAINAVNNTIGTCYVNQKMIYVTVPESVTTKEQANQLYGGMKVIYQLAEPQTIPLGKVELPALPEATSNVWNDGNIPADVSIIFYNENGRLLSKAIPEVDVATVDEVKKFLGIK